MKKYRQFRKWTDQADYRWSFKEKTWIAEITDHDGGKSYRKKFRSANRIISAAAVLLTAFSFAGCAGAPVSEKGSELKSEEQKPEYDQLIAQAEALLSGSEFEQAEALLQQAKETDPARSIAYEKLFALWTMQNQPETAENIEAEAKQSLPDSEQEGFQARISKIAQDLRPDPEWQVIAEIGSLDLAPISLDELGWLLVSQGQYSILLPDGSRQNLDGMDSLLLYNNSSQEALKYGAYASSSAAYGPGYEYSQGQLVSSTGGCGAGGFGVYEPYILDENNQVVLTEQVKISKNGPLNQMDYSIEEPIMVSRQPGVQGDETYLYTPVNQVLYGPYSKGEIPSFYLAAKSIPGLSFLGDMQRAGGPFWVHNSPEQYGHPDGIENRYSLLNADGSSRIEGFSGAQAVDSFSVGGFKSRRFYLYDRDLNELYNGLFQAGATPVNGKAPVKMDDTWKLISLDSSSGISDSATAEQDFASFAGVYGASKGGPGGGIWFEIAADGTFSCGMTQGTPSGIYSSEAFGSLAFEEGGSRMRISSLENVHPAGTSDLSGNFPVHYEEMPVLRSNGILQILPAGTPVSELPEGSSLYLEFYGMESGVLPEVMLMAEGGELFRKD